MFLGHNQKKNVHQFFSMMIIFILNHELNYLTTYGHVFYPSLFLFPSFPPPPKKKFNIHTHTHIHLLSYKVISITHLLPPFWQNHITTIYIQTHIYHIKSKKCNVSDFVHLISLLIIFLSRSRYTYCEFYS